MLKAIIMSDNFINLSFLETFNPRYGQATSYYTNLYFFYKWSSFLLTVLKSTNSVILFYNKCMQTYIRMCGANYEHSVSFIIPACYSRLPPKPSLWSPEYLRLNRIMFRGGFGKSGIKISRYNDAQNHGNALQKIIQNAQVCSQYF